MQAPVRAAALLLIARLVRLDAAVANAAVTAALLSPDIARAPVGLAAAMATAAAVGAGACATSQMMGLVLSRVLQVAPPSDQASAVGGSALAAVLICGLPCPQ